MYLRYSTIYIYCSQCEFHISSSTVYPLVDQLKTGDFNVERNLQKIYCPAPTIFEVLTLSEEFCYSPLLKNNLFSFLNLEVTSINEILN